MKEQTQPPTETELAPFAVIPRSDLVGKGFYVSGTSNDAANYASKVASNYSTKALAATWRRGEKVGTTVLAVMHLDTILSGFAEVFAPRSATSEMFNGSDVIDSILSYYQATQQLHEVPGNIFLADAATAEKWLLVQTVDGKVPASTWVRQRLYTLGFDTASAKLLLHATDNIEAVVTTTLLTSPLTRQFQWPTSLKRRPLHIGMDLWTTSILPGMNSDHAPKIDPIGAEQVEEEFGPIKGDHAPWYAGTLLHAEASRFNTLDMDGMQVASIPSPVLLVANYGAASEDELREVRCPEGRTPSLLEFDVDDKKWTALLWEPAMSRTTDTKVGGSWLLTNELPSLLSGGSSSGKELIPLIIDGLMQEVRREFSTWVKEGKIDSWMSPAEKEWVLAELQQLEQYRSAS